MQISTSSFYDRSATAMNKLAVRADTLNTQIATEKRLAAPSDDSVAFSRLRGLAKGAADDGAYAGNLRMADAVLSQADATLSAIGDQLQNASELAVRAKNGTFSAADRRVMGAELAGIVDRLVGLANTRDTRGQPLFGGVDGGAAVTRNADGGFTFASVAVPAIPIGEGQSVQANETAGRVFAIGDTDTLAVLATLAAALQSDAPLGDTVLTDITDGIAQAAAVQSSLGVRAVRVEMEQARLADTAIDRESARSALEDTDVPATIIELQKTMTILSATQASFGKLSTLSLFDYLR